MVDVRLIENPFQSPQTVELRPSDRVYESPLPGGWRPGRLLSAFMLGTVILLGILNVLFW